VVSLLLKNVMNGDYGIFLEGIQKDMLDKPITIYILE
jgi:hypothetical protein